MWFGASLFQPHGAIETFLLDWDFNCSAGSSFHVPLLRWVKIFETWSLKRFSSVLETAYQHMKRGSLESLVISCWERELWIHQALDLLHELGLVGHEPKTPARSNKVIQTFKAVFEYWTSVSKFVKLRLKTLNRFKRIEPPSLKASPKNGEKSSLWISWCGSSVNTLPALQLTVWRPFMHFEMQVVYSIFRLAALKICLMEHFW